MRSVDEVLAAHELILPALQALQEEFGYVPESALPAVARRCNVSHAEVYGVLTYYHDLRTTAPLAHRVRVCRAEACQAVGARELAAELTAELTGLGDEVEVGAAYCFGNCALGPTVEVDGQLIGRATAAEVRRRLG